MSKNTGKSISKEEKDAFIAKMRQAREQCFAIFFEMTFTDDSYQDIIDTAVESRLIVADEFTLSVLEYYSQNSEAVDLLIKQNIRGWAFDRLSRVPLSILRMSISEMKCRNTPASVAINEAVELTKKYGAEKEPAFVNAVLGAVVREKKDEQ